MSRPLWIILFAAALLLRLYRLEQPPLDFHPLRQYIGATVSRAMYLESQPQAPACRWLWLAICG